MANFSETIVEAAGEDRILNVRPDSPDIRDRMYEPALIQLESKLDNRALGTPLDQGQEGACTGFGLAAVINVLNTARKSNFIASPRMLYEMAQRNDMWPGQDYSGSSCRGAIQGWKNMGVCAEADWPYEAKTPGHLTVERARRARQNTLGAYYRLRPEISDYHAALNEVGAIFVSAAVHKGWQRPAEKRSKLSVIRPSSTKTGGHAFAIVGYTRLGFIVQNSWGDKWGTNGCALWRYEDWIENVSDGWVFRLALSTAQIFNKQSITRKPGQAHFFKRSPKRMEIAGHFAHFDDGSFSKKGKYFTDLSDVTETAQNLRKTLIENPYKYKHLVFYAHGGLNSTKDSALRIKRMKEGFKRNGIYPFHIMYDTGLAEELKDLIIRDSNRGNDRAEGYLDWLGNAIADTNDTLIEDSVRKPGTALWDEMKRDAREPFEQDSDGTRMLKNFSEAISDQPIKVHLVGHSTGAVVHGHLLDTVKKFGLFPEISSVSLFAPACTVDFYKKHYENILQTNKANPALLKQLQIYNLTRELENDDSVALVYRKSLITLVSNAFERGRDVPILGIQEHNRELSGPKIHYSNGKSGPTRSKTHGGFDNDHVTLNSTLKTILGHAPKHPFREKELK